MTAEARDHWQPPKAGFWRLDLRVEPGELDPRRSDVVVSLQTHLFTAFHLIDAGDDQTLAGYQRAAVREKVEAYLSVARGEPLERQPGVCTKYVHRLCRWLVGFVCAFQPKEGSGQVLFACSC